jgi:uncharacterized membrane protein YdfJ with MMPL/SSD domain
VVPVVLVAIAILLALLLRSLIAPLYLIATVGLSYLAALGFATLLFVRLGGADGLNFLIPILLFIFAMALGEDYNILLMTRVREEAYDHGLHDALTRAVGHTGGTITSAGIILAGTFTVLAIAGGSEQSRQLGLTVAFGILLDTFFVRTCSFPRSPPSWGAGTGGRRGCRAARPARDLGVHLCSRSRTSMEARLRPGGEPNDDACATRTGRGSSIHGWAARAESRRRR